MLNSNKLPTLIASTDQLDAVCANIEAAGLVAIDIEFVWSTTYYPRLGLVQVALSSERCWLLDVLAIEDLSRFGKILCDRNIIKIFHDAPQDLEILHRATGAVPCNVFDSRLASGYCGLLSTLSLASLLKEFFALSISKEEQRSDWCARPLSEEQMEYALIDVKHLPAAHGELTKRIAARGRTTWVAEDCMELSTPEFYRPRDARHLFRKVKGWTSLTRKQLAVLRELTVLRETEAQQRNRPRRHVLSDESLLRLATAMPTTEQSLTQSRAVSERTGQRYSRGILEAVAAGLVCPQAQWPQIPELPANWREIKISVNSAIDWFRAKGTAEALDPILIATNAEATALVSDGLEAKPENHKLLRGWRRGFVGEDILGKMMRRERIDPLNNSNVQTQ
jgi:ribonuclease D